MLCWQDDSGLHQIRVHKLLVFIGSSLTLKCCAQDTIDILDGSSIGGASHGKIEGSGVGGLGIGTLLQDLRETFLEMFGGTGKHRDRAAKFFDAQLRDIATAGQSC
jgi:hypothetical protein